MDAHDELERINELIDSSAKVHGELVTAWRQFIASNNAPAWILNPPIGRDLCSTKLSKRQIQVLTLVACDFSDKEIAKCLRIKTSTVKTHIHKILERMDVQTRREAARKGIAQGIIPVQES